MKTIDQCMDDVAREAGYKNLKDAKQMQYLPAEFIKASRRLAKMYAEEMVRAYTASSDDVETSVEKHLKP